jgi:hypothetical protein
LLALLVRGLRAKVIVANRADKRVRAPHAEGIGREFWVDAAVGHTPCGAGGPDSVPRE